MHDDPLRFESETGAVERGFLAPFQGGSLGGGCLLGLKRQAESWSPFGAPDQMSKLQGPKAQESKAQAQAWALLSWSPFGPQNHRGAWRFLTCPFLRFKRSPHSARETSQILLSLPAC
jgi:hypothetical protein